MKEKWVKRWLSLIMVLAMTAMLFAGCGESGSDDGSETTGSSSTETEDSGEVNIVYGIGASWTSIMPWDGPTTYSCMVQDNLFEPLAKAGDSELVYRAAESIEVSEDGTVWTVTLNPDVTWSDGEPCTAEDWVWTYEMETDPDFGTYSTSYMTSYLAGTDDSGVLIEGEELGMKALDTYTLEIRWKEATGVDSFFSWAGYYYRALPKHVLEGTDPSELATCDFWDDPVTNGCCTYVSEPVSGQEITLAAREDFYLGTPQFDTLTYLVVSGDNAPNALLNGDIDAFFNMTDYETLASLDGQNGLHVETFEGAADYLAMSINNVRFNANVRKALDMLIDKQALVDAFTNGYGYPIWNAVLGSEYTRERDVESAVAILEEEGFDFENTVISIACSEVRQDAAAIIQQCWLEAGVQSEIRVGETASIFADAISGDVDCCLMGNSMTYNPTVEETILDPATQNYGQIQSTAYVDLCQEIDFETDEEAKAELIAEFEELMAEECPYIYLYATPTMVPQSSRISGVCGQFDEPWNWVIQ